MTLQLSSGTVSGELKALETSRTLGDLMLSANASQFCAESLKALRPGQSNRCRNLSPNTCVSHKELTSVRRPAFFRREFVMLVYICARNSKQRFVAVAIQTRLQRTILGDAYENQE